MAFDFVMNFARDNDLQVYEGCSLPELRRRPRWAAGADADQQKAGAECLRGDRAGRLPTPQTTPSP